MFSELVRRIFKSSPNVSVGCGVNDAQKESSAHHAIRVDDSKLKPIYWLLAALSVCMIMLDLLLLMYVNHRMMPNVAPQTTTLWEMDTVGREQIRQVVLKVIREERDLMRQQSEYGADGSRYENQPLQFGDGYRDDR